jgi:hypothetical protein
MNSATGRKMGVRNRKTREGWPRLTVETEVNGDSKRTNERGPSLVGLSGLSRRYKRFLFCLGFSSLVQNMLLLTVHYFNSFAPIAQHAGQVAVLCKFCLSLSVCL